MEITTIATTFEITATSVIVIAAIIDATTINNNTAEAQRGTSAEAWTMTWTVTSRLQSDIRESGSTRIWMGIWTSQRRDSIAPLISI